MKKNQRKQKIRLIILIIIIIIILLLITRCATPRVGKIGYDDSTLEVDPPIIEISDGSKKFDKQTKIDIFSNSEFNNKKIIAPGSNGSYDFVIENKSDKKLKYDITFKDEMDNPVNMNYKLKIDGVYIHGNKDNYVSIEDLQTKDLSIMGNSKNLITIDWKWIDNDIEDTYTASQKNDQHYTLGIYVYMSE